MGQPNILHIIQCTNLGGMEKSTLEVMTAVRNLGCDNRLISLNPIGGLGPLLTERRIPALGLNYRGPAGVASIPEMARAFREGDGPDGIVMTGHNLSAFAALSGHQCKRRILFVHFHHEGVMSRLHWQIVYAAAMRIFPRIAFCADFIRQEAEEIYPPLHRVSVTQPDSVKVLPLPSERDRVAARSALGVSEDAYVVGNAGWLIGRKRWDVFLRTASRIAAFCPQTMFLACGDGPMRTELMKLSLELGLEGRIRWLGWQQDLSNFYLSLDVLLFNSDWDAVGLTPLEAAAHGTPVVASVLHGGLREVIQSEREGFLINRHDDEWLADKVILLLQNPELRRLKAAACRKVLVKRHDPSRNAMKLLELLELSIPVEYTA
jgi:glycosyltransferase involved in cell wall biosynthesis